MIRKAFKMYLKAGCADEYEKRHNELWPEMKAMIHEYGGHNYSIFLDDETNILYGYIEIEDEEHNQQPMCQSTCLLEFSRVLYIFSFLQ